MDSLNKSRGKVSIGVPSRSSTFTFVPVVQNLPFKSIMSAEETSEVPPRTPNENVAVSHERTTGETMSDREIFKAEFVFIKDSAEGGAGNVVPAEPQLRLKPSLHHVSHSLTKASSHSVSAQPENTSNHITAGTTSMETAVDKHRGISHRQCHDTCGRAEVSLGCFANRVSEDRSSPTDSVDLFPTMASSRDSLLSDGSDKDKSWSAAQPSSVVSPLSFSRTISPCSSVLSGFFSPSVTQIKRHFLAPGSSLVHIPQTCFSSCESLSSSVCLQSPPPPRHRPPLTRLSLLTAILRKGRLPVLSSAHQRPYTPCWPVNPVTLSFCKACSAASSVASIPLEFSSRFSSSVSIDSTSHVHKEANKCATALSPVQSAEHGRTRPQAKRCCEQTHSGSVLRGEQVISPPPAKSKRRPRAPLSLLSNFKSVSPAEHEEMFDCATPKQLHHTHTPICLSLELKSSSNTATRHTENHLKNLSPKPVTERDTSAPHKRSHPSNSSLSRLHLLSQKLRSPPGCRSTPSQSRSPVVTVFTACSDAASPPPHPPLSLQTTSGWCELERSGPASKPDTPSQGFYKAHCLSPSRYTPINFLGWPSPTSSPALTPSPAPPIRDLTPSPSLSMRSTTPSPRPWSGISDCSDREGKKRKTHKIKLSYKSLAAIPTNTLLMDQQAIDEQVERIDSSSDTLDRRSVADTHAEMCSPAQLRQQSEELYAAIDEILADSIPAPSRSSTPNVGLQQTNSSLPKSLGRETKYASLGSLPQSVKARNLLDPKKTKPGVIRPMTAIPRLTVEGEEEFNLNPFRPSVVKQTLTFNKKAENRSPEKIRSPKGITSEERKIERRRPFSQCDLQITEAEDMEASASSEHSEEHRAALETHI